MSNIGLRNAKSAKKDEFYTQLEDIECELLHHEDYFKNKVVYCNCDDPSISQFFEYFSGRFDRLKLAGLITTCYKNRQWNLFSENRSDRAISIEYEGARDEDLSVRRCHVNVNLLKGDGDFRSQECIALLKKADIVVTNPPFSLFREFVAQLIQYKKDFLILGNMNSATTKDIFPLFKADKMWFGPSITGGDREFGVPHHYPLSASTHRTDSAGRRFIRVKGVRWFTNIEHKKRYDPMHIYKRYSPDEYPRYDNYDAIEVSKTRLIPQNWGGGQWAFPLPFWISTAPLSLKFLVHQSNVGEVSPMDCGMKEVEFITHYLRGRGNIREYLLSTGDKMDIEPVTGVTVGSIVNGYHNDVLTGRVTGFGGLLDIRPPYQREFIYKPKLRNAVVDTVSNGYPLNAMYWAKRSDGVYEVIDGQQRTISICEYCQDKFSVGNLFNRASKRSFNSLLPDEQKRIEDYPLLVYQVLGTDSDRLRWFETINIAGVPLSKQEIRNAVYYGTWLEHAKKIFSRKGCAAYDIGAPYVSGTVARQEFLECAIKWINEGDIVGYMDRSDNDPDAPDGDKLWEHFENVISWVESIFINYRPALKGLDWGKYYKGFKDVDLDPVEIEEKVSRLIQNLVELKGYSIAGIYQYVLTGEARHLHKRLFSSDVKQAVYDIQGGVCPETGKKMKIEEMEADHIIPWVEGGPTTLENCQMICKSAHKEKTRQQVLQYCVDTSNLS